MISSNFIKRIRFPLIFSVALSVLIIFLLTNGCGGNREYFRQSHADVSKGHLRSMSYTVQVGAYSILDNAINVTEILEKEGFDPYYFRDKDRLYKVRFGDFQSRVSALNIAERLLSEGMIDSYYIVGPDEYALSRVKEYGTVNLRKEIVTTAKSFIGMPYRWGGSSPNEGFDCSGLAMAVYQINGLNLPRSTRDQYASGIPVVRGNLKKGDLVFFKILSGRRVSHVGVYIGDEMFIHAPSKGKTIRTDSLSNGYFDRRYAGGRCYIR